MPQCTQDKCVLLIIQGSYTESQALFRSYALFTLTQLHTLTSVS